MGAPWITRAVLDILRAAGFHVGWVQVITERVEQDRHVEAAGGAQIAAQRSSSLEPSGSIGYDRRLGSAKWKMSAEAGLFLASQPTLHDVLPQSPRRAIPGKRRE